MPTWAGTGSKKKNGIAYRLALEQRIGVISTAAWNL